MKIAIINDQKEGKLVNYSKAFMEKAWQIAQSPSYYGIRSSEDLLNSIKSWAIALRSEHSDWTQTDLSIKNLDFKESGYDEVSAVDVKNNYSLVFTAHVIYNEKSYLKGYKLNDDPLKIVIDLC